MGAFPATNPLRMPLQEECIFYHTISYPNGEMVEGAWDIRGSFAQYIGNFPLEGKAVLDVGTAGGFLAFEAELAGARVTALDASEASEFQRLHFRGSLYHLDRVSHVAVTEKWLEKLKAGFWYSWHRYGSHVEMVYAPLARLAYWDRQFDVVVAGAIIEHLADPVSVIGDLARLAREAVIIAFTPVVDSDEQFMETATDWKNPHHDFTFWSLSRGLYRRIFANVGFTVEFVPAMARWEGHDVMRTTIIARRAVRPEAIEVDVAGNAPADDANLAQSSVALRAQLDSAIAEREAALSGLTGAIRERDAAIAEADSLRQSTSWSVTAPLRALSSVLRSR